MSIFPKPTGEKLSLGSWYNVPTINGWPVLLPSHYETDICVAGGEIPHYHYDWRFINEEPQMLEVQRAESYQVTWDNRPCLRAIHPEFVPLMFFQAQLIKRYRDAKLVCGKCPHRGIDVDKTTGQCPGHGLRFNLTTGELAHKEASFACGPMKASLDSYPKITFKAPRNIEAINYVELVADAGEILGRTVFNDIIMSENDTLTITDSCKGIQNVTN